jgi:processive 1,2-diacylglycerol beta-glucosyltransferase
MVQLYDAEQGTPLGQITDEQLQFLIDQLEEESLTDRDYYISADTVDMLEDEGADSALVDALRQALGGREGMDVRWERE